MVKAFAIRYFADSYYRFFCSGTSLARNTSISGKVIDAEAGTPLVDVHVSLLRDAERESLFRTGRTGEFRFNDITSGTYTLRFERVGYETLDQEIAVNADPAAMQVELKRNPLQLGEVIVTPGDEEHAHFEKTTDLNLSAQELDQQMGATIAETLSGEVGIAQRTMGRATARPVIRGMGGDRLLILEDGERTGDKSASSADHAVAIDPTTVTNIEITVDRHRSFMGRAHSVGSSMSSARLSRKRCLTVQR